MKNQLNNILRVTSVLILGVLLGGCFSERKETPTKGIASVAVAESIEPVIRLEMEMFTDLYKDARVQLHPLPARSAVVEFFNVDSIKALITSRPLNAEERDVVRRTGLALEEYKVALDAVAVITHPLNAVDSMRTTQLDSVFRGLISTWERLDRMAPAAPILVCLPDQNSGEFEILGTRILKGKTFAPAARIAATSPDMIDFVAKERRAIGAVSIAWLRNNLDRVKVVAMSDPLAPDSLKQEGQAFTPIQGYMYKGLYPLTTDLMIYSKADKYGVAAGFISFISSAPGQKIFLNNGLVPATMPVRIVQLSNKELTQ